jgi:hypothetical protein
MFGLNDLGICFDTHTDTRGDVGHKKNLLMMPLRLLKNWYFLFPSIWERIFFFALLLFFAIIIGLGFVFLIIKYSKLHDAIFIFFPSAKVPKAPRIDYEHCKDNTLMTAMFHEGILHPCQIGTSSIPAGLQFGW